MANVLFKRVEDSTQLDNIPVVDGSFYVTGDGKSFIDYGEERLPVGGTPDTEMSDRSTNAVENKVIKQYVDGRIENQYNFQYNQTPFKTGRQINGKDEYIYGMEINNLPNNSTATYTTSISLSNVGIITEVGGTGVREGVTWFNFNGNRLTTNLEIELSTGNNNGYLTFVLATGYDRSNVKGYVYVKYTLNS